MNHASASRHWNEHLDSGVLIVELLAGLAHEMSDSPACSHLLPKLQDLEGAIAASEQAAYRAIRALDRQTTTWPTHNARLT